YELRNDECLIGVVCTIAFRYSLLYLRGLRVVVSMVGQCESLSSGNDIRKFHAFFMPVSDRFG
ncbi:MAG: hypothetical protein PUC14_05625, partial [Bacteroidales bacterium]|nr:hypothetical protein [Bacteroidales bacterium]